jgi:hypothetical protein
MRHVNSTPTNGLLPALSAAAEHLPRGLFPDSLLLGCGGGSQLLYTACAEAAAVALIFHVRALV